MKWTPWKDYTYLGLQRVFPEWSLSDLTRFSIQFRAVVSGGVGGALAPPEFGSSVNPITTRGADYAHNFTASPPGFENPVASL